MRAELVRRRKAVALHLVLLAFSAVILGSCGGQPETQSAHIEGAVNRRGEVHRELKRRFGALAGAPTGLPFEVAETQPLPSRLSPSEAWLVLPGVSRQVWALAGDHQLCLLDRSLEGGAGVVCSEVKQVVVHGIMSTVLQDPAKGQPAKRSVVGLVPDQARRVRIHTPGFPTVTRPVERNVFVLTDHIPQPPETLELLEGRSAPIDTAR